MRLHKGKAPRQRTAKPMMRKPNPHGNHTTAAAAGKGIVAYVTIFFLALWAMVLPRVHSGNRQDHLRINGTGEKGKAWKKQRSSRILR